jgi:exonuclease VII small subunit
MKKVKMIDIYSSVSTINSILELKMSIDTSKKLVDLIKEINEHLQVAEKTRNELLEKYGKKTPKGEYNIPDNKKKQFTEDLNKYLFDTEVSIYSPLLKKQDFDRNFTISPSDLTLISYLMDYD